MAASYQNIIDKIRLFIHKYYVNELLKGLILFTAIGLLYFLFVAGLESFFWFGSGIRQLLFWLFLGVEAVFFSKLVLLPLFQLFKLSKGIDKYDAAQIIGQHFPKIDDQLINILQLKEAIDIENSDLLLASINQKAAALQPIAFNLAVDYKSNLKYLKFLCIPIAIILLLWLVGKSSWYSIGYKRISHYNQVYEPPAPFQIKVLNDTLSVEEGQSLALKVGTIGSIQPSEIRLISDTDELLLKAREQGQFSYVFENLKSSFTFYLEAAEVTSHLYKVDVVKTPKISALHMNVIYPSYLKKPKETITGLRPLSIPEGSQVIWNIIGKDVDYIDLWIDQDSVINFDRLKNDFRNEFTFLKSANYAISSSNSNLQDYQTLKSHVKIIKDHHPELKIEAKTDSLEENQIFFRGQASDDYGLSILNMVYYQEGEDKIKVPMSLVNNNFQEFYKAFPDTLQIEKGKSYNIYFEVFDNDGVNGPKLTQSETFLWYNKSADELEQHKLNQGKSNINDFQKSLDQLKNNSDAIIEFERKKIEGERSSFKMKSSLKSILEKEKNLIDASKGINDKLKNNLESISDKSNEKKNLQQRLEKNSEELLKNEDLLKALEKYQKDISSDQLNDKLREFGKQQKNQFRSLESLLELTKRLYVSQQQKQLKNELGILKKLQDKLADRTDDSSKEQESVNDGFKKWQDKFSDLEVENQALRRPKKLNRDKAVETELNKRLKDALEQLNSLENIDNQLDNINKFKKEANTHQQKSRELMKMLLDNMQDNMNAMHAEQLSEDIGMLRRILANLLTFSFDQEDLMLAVREISEDHPGLSDFIKKQQSLKDNFKHVDDSLYALALRNSSISDAIYKDINTIDYNMDRGLENLSKNRVYQAGSNLRFILSSSNALANLLDDALQNMEMDLDNLNGQGMPQKIPSEGEFQLDDIIRGQERLQQELNNKDSDENTDGDGHSNGGKNRDDNVSFDGNSQAHEDEFKERLEMYKEQVRLREKLEELAERYQLNEAEVDNLKRNMSQSEDDILSGISRKENKDRMSELLDQLLRLKEGHYNKEKDDKRESNTNRKTFEGNKLNYEFEAKKKFNSTEILDRQVLPLQNLYQLLIKDYFKTDD